MHVWIAVGLCAVHCSSLRKCVQGFMCADQGICATRAWLPTGTKSAPEVVCKLTCADQRKHENPLILARVAHTDFHKVGMSLYLPCTVDNGMQICVK